MTNPQALQVLQQYQRWRRYDGPSPDPKQIGVALDVAIKHLAEVCA